jgi:hypothetical protein
MMPTAPGMRVLAASLVALALFAIAFLAGRSSSREPALAPARVQALPGFTALRHAPLRAIGSVPALPRAARKPASKATPRPSTRATPPPAVAAPPAPPSAQSPFGPDCVGEFC